MIEPRRAVPALTKIPGHFLGGLASVLLSGLLAEASRALRER